MRPNADSVMVRSRFAGFSGLVVGVAVVLTAAGCSSTAHTPSTHTSTPSSPAATALTAASLLSSSLAKAKAQSWTHVVVSSRQKGGAVASVVQDSGPGKGQQSIHVGAVVARVIVENGQAYIQGNAQAVTSYFGFPATDATVLAGRWISIPSSDSSFGTVSAGVSLDSVLAETGLNGDLTKTAETSRDGQSVIGVSGVNSSPDAGGGTGTLYVDVATSLPVEFDGTSPQGSEKVLFSDWGKSVHLQTPTNPRPITSIK